MLSRGFTLNVRKKPLQSPTGSIVFLRHSHPLRNYFRADSWVGLIVVALKR